MAKQRKESELNLAEIKRASDVALADIAECCRLIADLKAEAEAEVADVNAQYAMMFAPLQERLTRNEAWLKDTMKSNRGVLFDGTDVVDLAHGSLIRSKADRVTIPRNALAECEKQGLEDAIKTVKSLDREAVEKWPDARLALIGATRKPKEDFSYSLKEGKP